MGNLRKFRRLRSLRNNHIMPSSCGLTIQCSSYRHSAIMGRCCFQCVLCHEIYPEHYHAHDGLCLHCSSLMDELDAELCLRWENSADAVQVKKWMIKIILGGVYENI